MNSTLRQSLSNYMIERLPDYYDPYERTVDPIGLTQHVLVNMRLADEVTYYEVLNLAQSVIRQAERDYHYQEGENV